MRLVILESPFAGATPADRHRNEMYLRRCIRDSIQRGESPYASHKILPGALDDTNYERKIGIEAGYAWWAKADAIVFYLDHGMSGGMAAAMVRARKDGYVIEERRLENN